MGENAMGTVEYVQTVYKSRRESRYFIAAYSIFSSYPMQNYFFLSLSVFFAALSAVNASSYSIQLFSDSNCEDLLAEDSGTFATNGCISQSGVNSIRITSLDNAMIHTWMSEAPVRMYNF